MPKFRHRVTDRVIDVDDSDAHRYQTSSWVSLDEETIEVPDGTVAEILAWVGDDVDRRNAAVEAEEKGKRRKGILALGE